MTNITQNTNAIRNANGGWTRCRICGQNVYGNWWTKYTHCFKHAWNSVLPIAELVTFCFGITK